MLVMAIEAANQIADRSRHILGFEIIDAQFSNALRIPSTAEGIETQLHLRIRQNTGEKDCLAADFKLYACEKSHWIRNGHGVIRAVYSQIDNASGVSNERQAQFQLQRSIYDQVLDASKASISRDEFYDRMWRMGYTFGPDFQVLSDLRATENRRAVARVDCYTWPSDGKKNKRQQHIVHPITLDAFFQAEVAANCHAAQIEVATSVPSSVQRLWVASSGLSFQETQHLRLRAEISNADNLGFEGSFTGFDDQLEKIVVEASGFKARYVIGAPKQSTHQTQICYSTSWMPDVDFLTAENVSIFYQSLHPLDPDVSPSYQHVGRFLSVLLFKDPQLKILQLNSKCGQIAQSLLKHIASFQSASTDAALYSNWLVTDSSTANLEEAAKALTDYAKLEFQQLDCVSDLLVETQHAESYDVILPCHVADVATTLSSVRKLLKPGGKVLLIGSREPMLLNGLAAGTADTNLSSKVDLKDYGFSDSPLYLSAHDPNANSESAVLLALSKQTPQGAREPLRYLLIVDTTSQRQLQLAKLVQASLTHLNNADSAIISLKELAATRSLFEIVLVSFLELEEAVLTDLSPDMFDILRISLSSTKGVLWLTAEGGSFGTAPEYSLVDGLSKVLRLENERLKFVTAKLETVHEPQDHQARFIIDIIRASHFDSSDQNYESTYLQASGLLYINRLLAKKDLTEQISFRTMKQQSKAQSFGAGPPLRLAIGMPGLLDTLHWIEDKTLRANLPSDEVEVKVHAVGANFKDLLLAMGRVGGTTFGNECAGVVSRAGSDSDFKPGDRVCLLATAAFSTFVRAKAAGVATIPDGISMALAASMPAQFGSVFYCMHNLARMQRGESILIHSGAGGTGQAAIQMARRLDAEIFVTVGSSAKKQFLTETYGIPEDHIFDSRTTDFLHGIRRMTKNRGIDVVLNTLGGEGLRASWECIASYGRFVELGKREAQANAPLPMGPFQRNTMFAAYEGSIIGAERPAVAKAFIQGVLNMFSRGELTPVKPLKVMSIAETGTALRALQDRNSIGKSVLEVTEDAVVPVSIELQVFQP